MESTIRTDYRISIPQSIVRELGLQPGWKLDWRIGPQPGEILLRVLPGRGELARRLLGKGAHLAPDRFAVDELVAERETSASDSITSASN